MCATSGHAGQLGTFAKFQGRLHRPAPCWNPNEMVVLSHGVMYVPFE